jgi:hypothetical protein
VFRAHFSILFTLGLTAAAVAEPLSKKTDVDFFRDVPSRNLKGLATRSDGRLVAGPTLREITAVTLADLLWCIAPTNDAAKFLLGTGPDGKIIEITFNATFAAFTARDFAKLDDPQIFALKPLPDGSVLAGTSPKGALCLIRDGRLVARAALPVDSIFDLLLVDENTVLAATGNPGRIYRIDLKKFAAIGLIADKITDAKILSDRGITLFGELRDRNVRRIAALPDGRIVAGSSPKGNVYTFAAGGGAPFILQENRDAEVTDLLIQPNGDIYASIVFAGSSGESRILPATTGRTPKDQPETPPPAQAERFGGRSSVVWFPAKGFAETLTSRSGIAFYRLARHGDTLVMAGGEQGDLLGFNLKARLSLTFAGSVSSQLNGLLPLPSSREGASAEKFLLLRNNAPGIAVLDFTATGAREAETRRLDLGTPALMGALRPNRLRNITGQDLAIDVRLSNGSDDLEGWSDWMPLEAGPDAGWRAQGLRGRYAKLRIRVLEQNSAAKRGEPNTDSLEIDRAALFSLPQNRRPQLQDFRVLTPNFGLIVASPSTPPANVALSQLMQPAPREEDGKRRTNFLSSQVVPAPGAQVVLWTVTDPDNDNFTFAFSIRREGDQKWIDIASNIQESHVQFDTAHLPDGIYFTRLVATETAPRPADERLAQIFETDDLIVDHTTPEVLEATARRNGDVISVSVRGRDALSLLDGMEAAFNNGVRETVEQPADGVRDGREETFVLEIPLARLSNATSVEVTLYDAAGNGVARRLTW